MAHTAGRDIHGGPVPADQRARPWIQRRSLAAGAWLPVLAIVLVAALFRLWQIGTIPPGLFGDEATDGLDALDVLAGHGSVFFPANYGREGLHIWLVAGMFRLFGVSAAAVRLPSVGAGILTVLATCWLGLELAQAWRSAGAETQSEGRWLPATARLAALLPALYLATSYFHVHFSRFGIRGVFTPLCGALAFAAFWRGANTPFRCPAAPAHQRFVWYALSGLFLGLGLHFYTASRFYPVFLVVFLLAQAAISLARRRRDEAILIRDFRPLVLLVLVAVLTFLPLGLYFWQHPGSFAQRASEVSAFNEGNAWQRVGQAALANVLQFVVPGAGDQAQFYNLPGRAVFDPLTALLALLGLGGLLIGVRRPAALFLVLWWPAMLVPSFLATDRFPTLPRVLGTLPGVYFFPAAGLLVLLGILARLTGTRGRAGPSSAHLPLVIAVGVPALALIIHASATYVDYFLVWGRSPQTFEAFETDMTQAARWLTTERPSGHVYLSSDIYRHPTLMLLHERTGVLNYFSTADPALSWFDARSALPLPPAGEPATYLLSNSAPPGDPAAAWIAQQGTPMTVTPSPGEPGLLSAVTVSGSLSPRPDFPAVDFGGGLALIGAGWTGGPDPTPILRLYWQTGGPDPAGWPGFRLQIEGQVTGGEHWQQELPLDDFRPPEWVAGGRFLTWRAVRLPAETARLPGELRLRLVSAATGAPVIAGAASDGWHTVPVAQP